MSGDKPLPHHLSDYKTGTFARRDDKVYLLPIKNCSITQHLCNQSSHYEKYDFLYEGKPSRATTKSTPFAVNKDEWDTKENTGKSMKNALYILRYAKRYVSS